MDLPVTIALVVALLVIAALCNYKARRPYEPGRLPLFPYLPVQYISIILALVFGIHLVALLTGWDLPGGRGRGGGLF